MRPAAPRLLPKVLPKAWIVSLAVLLLTPLAVGAQDTDIDWTAGPATVALGDGLGQLRVENGYLFADAATTRRIMELTGNPPSELEIGLVAPEAESKEWFIVLEFDAVGYVRDDEKDAIDADAILENVVAATEEANKIRRANGFDAVHVKGWFEEPHYDQESHNLVWAIEAEDDSGDRVVNYNVRLLGRRGYTSVTLVTDPATLAADRPEVARVIGSFSYTTGNRYADFVAGDKVAQYGLTALIAGGAGAAAAKLGLFAQLGKVLAKAWKLVVVAFVALGAAIKRAFAAVFRRPGSRTYTYQG